MNSTPFQLLCRGFAPRELRTNTGRRARRNGATRATGVIEVVVVLGAIALAGWLFGPSIGQKMKDRKAAKIEKKVDAKKAEAAKQNDAQLVAAHQFIVGTNAALATVEPEHRTPAVELAAELGDKAESALAAGRNQDLTPAQRAAITDAVRLALSPLQEEIKQGRAALALISKDLDASVAREAKLAGEITALSADLAAAQEDAAEAGARYNAIMYYVKLGGLTFAFIVWGLPLLGKFFPALEPIVRGSQWLVSQAGGAAMNTLNATVRGIEKARTKLKTINTEDAPSPEAAAYAKKKIDEANAAVKSGLSEEIYDAHDARIQQIRRAKGLL